MTELAEELEAQIPSLLDDEDAGPTTFVLQVNLFSSQRLSLNFILLLLPLLLLLLLMVVVTVPLQ